MSILDRLTYLEGIRDTLNELRLVVLSSDPGPHIDTLDASVKDVSTTIKDYDAGPHIDDVATAITATDPGPHIDGVATAVTTTDAGPHIDKVEEAITATDAGPHIDGVATAVTATDAGPHIDALAGDIAAGLNALAAAINRIAAAEETQLVTPLPDPSNPPIPGDPPDPATDPAPGTHPDWDSYLCGAGAVLCDSIAGMADEIRAIQGTLLWGVIALVGVIGGILGTAFTSGFSLVVAVASVIELWALLGATGESLIDQYMENIADEMRTNTTLRSCVSAAMRNGDGVDGKIAAIKTAIETNFTGSGAGIAELMVFPEAVEALAYGVDDGAGGVEYAATPTGVVCACIPPEYALESFVPNGNDPSRMIRFGIEVMNGRLSWTGNPRVIASNAYRWWDYSDMGADGDLLITSIEFDYSMMADYPPQTAGYAIRYADGDEEWVELPYTTDWTRVTVTPQQKALRAAGGTSVDDAFFILWAYHNGEDKNLIEFAVSHVDMVHNGTP